MMKTFTISFSVALLLAGLFQYTSAQKKDTVTIEDRLSRIENNITEVRRDQLNYQMERDLLKEAFASNFQTINMILAIVLGVFTFIGFFGMRDISSLKKQYVDELQTLNTQRLDFEKLTHQYQDDLSKVKEAYLTVIKAHEEHNRRIKALEVQQQVITLFQSKNYQRGLEVVNAALGTDPNSIPLLMEKGRCLWRLDDLSGAIEAFSRILELEEHNTAAGANLLELYLITGQLAECPTILKKFRLGIVRVHGDAPIYLEVLQDYQRNDAPVMRGLIEKYIQSLPPEKSRRSTWDFADALKVLQPKNEEARGALLLLLISILNGETGRDEAVTKLAEIK